MPTSSFLTTWEIMNRVFDSGSLSVFNREDTILNAVYDTGSVALRVNVTNLPSGSSTTAAADVTIVPSGSISATNVQDAIYELDSEKTTQLEVIPLIIALG